MSTAIEINPQNWCEAGYTFATDVPFVVDGWKYMARPIRVIRVKTDEPNSVAPENKRFPNCADLFEDIPSDGWAPWPDASGFVVEHSWCHQCDGHGVIDTETCPECEGAGETECPKCFRTDDCDECDGDGYIGGTECPTCHGGEKLVQPDRIKCGNLWVRWDNDAAVRELPNPTFACVGDMVFIRSEGAEAIVMCLDERLIGNGTK